MRVPRAIRPGLTLIELLVVFAIIGVLIGLILPAVQRTRDNAAKVECGHQLRQIALALHGYHDTHHALPPGLRGATADYPYLSWHARILPFVEQEALWQDTQAAFAQQRNFWIVPPHAGLGIEVPIYSCPSNPLPSALIQPENTTVAFTTYLGVSGTNQGAHDGLLYYESNVRFSDVTDGLSNTLMVGERPPGPDFRFGWWYAGVGQQYNGSADMVLGALEWRDPACFRTPTCPVKPYPYGPGSMNNPCDIFHFWSLHGGGANFGFADGSVRFLRYDAAMLLPSLATRAGGEVVAPPD
jgi:prepilin-type processing-associated H-X9-DG protein/prepilin-type N-terminal cleavage/methylation domain-containing protein